MRKDFIEKNKLTMEEKNRLNEIYGTGIRTCYGDTDSFKVALNKTDLENINITSEDKARCEYESVLKTGRYPIPDYKYVTISEKAIKHIEFLDFQLGRIKDDLDGDLAEDTVILDEIIKIFDCILLDKYVKLDTDLKETYFKTFYGIEDSFNKWKESRLTDKED